jgi:hypothetical protein
MNEFDPERWSWRKAIAFWAISAVILWELIWLFFEAI